VKEGCVLVIMATPSNFYKNSVHAYARELDLSSVLENLHAYRLATGGGSAPAHEEPGNELDKEETEDATTTKADHGKGEKRRHHPYSRHQKKKKSTEVNEVGLHVMPISEVAKRKLESLGYQPSIADANIGPQGNASSILGYDPYERTSDDKRFSRAGLGQEQNALTSLLGFDATQSSSSDNDNGILWPHI